MDDKQRHLKYLLNEAAEKLRAFQLYEIGQGHGAVTDSVNRLVVHALTASFQAIREIEDAAKHAPASTEAI